MHTFVPLLLFPCFTHSLCVRIAWRVDFSNHFIFHTNKNPIPSQTWEGMAFLANSLTISNVSRLHHAQEIVPYFDTICNCLKEAWGFADDYPMVRTLWNNLRRGALTIKWVTSVEYDFISYTDGTFRPSEAIWTTDKDGEFLVGRVLFVIKISGVRHFQGVHGFLEFTDFPQPPNVSHLMAVRKWTEIGTDKKSNLLYFWNSLPIFKEEGDDVHMENLPPTRKKGSTQQNTKSLSFFYG